MPERINPRTAPTIYIVFMAVWVYGFAGAHWSLPAPAVFLLLLLPALVHFGLGYVVARWEALSLAAVPVLLALAASGFHSLLWISLVLLMIFPGAPLIAAGVYVREWQKWREDPSSDAWLY